VGLVLGCLAVAVVASPWVARALPAVAGKVFTFSRVFDRVFEVLLVVGLVAAWRRLDLGGAAAIGLRDPAWAARLGRGLAIGLAGLAVGLVLCWLGGALVPELRFPAAKTVRKAALGVGAAVLLGVGEETLFRGVLLRRLMADTGRTAGIALTTLVYAVVHVMRGRGSPHVVDAWSGVERLEAMVAPLAHGGALPEVTGLALLGLLLAAARLRSGSLWLPIGIHAAWVGVFRVGRLFFALGREPAWLAGAGWPPLVGGAAAWTAVLVSWLLLRRAR
jgi:membrane protease YdiL (CAAX protease family)